MEAQSSGAPNARASFGGTSGRPRDLAHAPAPGRGVLRLGWSIGLIAMAWFTAGAWGLGTRDGMYLYQVDYSNSDPRPGHYDYLRGESHTLLDLVRHEPPWAATAAGMLLIPLWFLVWRRTAMSGGRWIGVLWSLCTTAAVITLASSRPVTPGMELHGYYPTLAAAGVMLALAFVVAPPAQRRRQEDELDANELRILMRRHREGEAP